MSDVMRKQNRRILADANNERSYQTGGAVTDPGNFRKAGPKLTARNGNLESVQRFQEGNKVDMGAIEPFPEYQEYDEAEWWKRPFMGDPRVTGGTAPLAGGLSKLPKLFEFFYAARGGKNLYDIIQGANRYIRPNWMHKPTPGVPPGGVPATIPKPGGMMVNPKGPNWIPGKPGAVTPGGVPAVIPKPGQPVQYPRGINWQWGGKGPGTSVVPYSPVGPAPPLPGTTWNTYLPFKSVIPGVGTIANEAEGLRDESPITPMDSRDIDADIAPDLSNQQPAIPTPAPERVSGPSFSEAFAKARRDSKAAGLDPWEGTFRWTTPSDGIEREYHQHTKEEWAMKNAQEADTPITKIESRVAPESKPELRAPSKATTEKPTESKEGMRKRHKRDRKETRKGAGILYEKGKERRTVKKKARVKRKAEKKNARMERKADRKEERNERKTKKQQSKNAGELAGPNSGI